MLGAGLLARNAAAKGLKAKPWVKTMLSPGSKVVTDYYAKAGLTDSLEALGFYNVGYGCTTCIGNSGPLPEEVSAAVNQNDLAVTPVTREVDVKSVMSKVQLGEVDRGGRVEVHFDGLGGAVTDVAGDVCSADCERAIALLRA